MEWVFNTLFHDIVSISGVPLLLIFPFAYVFFQKLTFISHEAFPHKILPLFPAKILVSSLMDIYFQSIQYYLESHLRVYHERFVPIPFLNGIWQESHVLVSHFSK